MSVSVAEFMQRIANKDYYQIEGQQKTNSSEDFYNAISEIVDRNGHIGRIPKKHCLHRLCSQCHGNGVKQNGEICVHFISCNCPLCTTYSM